MLLLLLVLLRLTMWKILLNGWNWEKFTENTRQWKFLMRLIDIRDSLSGILKCDPFCQFSSHVSRFPSKLFSFSNNNVRTFHVDISWHAIVARLMKRFIYWVFCIERKRIFFSYFANVHSKTEKFHTPRSRNFPNRMKGKNSWIFHRILDCFYHLNFYFNCL